MKLIDGLAGDVKVALRSLVHSPSYVAVTVLTLALGIGATTAIFSVVDGVLLRPLPYRDADRLITVLETAPGFDQMSVSYPDLLDWQRDQSTLESIGAFRTDTFNLIGKEQAERIYGGMISANLLATLGLEPAVGRTFTAEEDRENGPPVALLGYGLWQRRYAGSPDVIGQSVNLAGKVFTVVGVLPRDFVVDPKIELVTPLGRITGKTRERGNHPGILAIGRMKPGVTVARARADLESVGKTIAVAFPNNANVAPAVRGFRDFFVKDVRTMLLVLMGAVVFVLLVAVANVANLALARGTARRKEMAVRSALGAGRLQLIRQVLVEAALVSSLGGVLGVLLALWGVDLLSSLRPEKIPDSAVIRVDLLVLGFSLAVSMATGLLFGVLPALQAARADIGDVLKDADQRTATGGRRQGRTRNILVVAEVALALVLLVGAGLTVRAFAALSRLDPGFIADNSVTMSLALSMNEYDSAAKVQSFRDRLRASLEAIPGVAHASLSSGMPIAGASESSYLRDGEVVPPGQANHFAVYYPVDGAFADAMRLRLVAGRFIRDDDRAGQTMVVVVDELLARARFGGDDPIGKRLKFFGGTPEIVGVVGHVVSYGLGEREAAEDQIYLSWQQLPAEWFAQINRHVQITVRAHEGFDASTLVAPVTAAAQALDPQQPIYEVQSLRKLLGDSLGARRFTMLLLGIFSALALVLAVVGLYSVMSYLVAQRRQEVGIRMALGARPIDVQRLVVGQGLLVTGIGLVIGTVASFLLAGVMSSLLYGVEPTDPLTFIAVAGILLLAATVATWLPARRASRIDPMIALRNQG